MHVIARHSLPHSLRAAGLHSLSREFPDVCATHRLTVREAGLPAFVGGPHRKLTTWDTAMEAKCSVANRPALADFIAALFAALPASHVLAVVEPGAFWLNNRAQAARLCGVPDAQNVSRFLRQRGLTDRFQGGFQVARPDYHCTLPCLAANTYAGGANVLFAALNTPTCRLTALACSHYDIHLTSLQPLWLDVAAQIACARGLAVERLDIPELWELEEPLAEIWTPAVARLAA